MNSKYIKKHITNYEEIQNKKLQEFYVIVQEVTVEVMLGKKSILENTKLSILYGLDILGNRTIIGIYKENKEDNRYWINELEKVKKRGLRKILYVSVEESNKRLEQALKIVYNPKVEESINERIIKIAKYTQKKWSSAGEQELVKAYVSETREEYEEKMKEIEKKYEKNIIGSMLIRELKEKMDKDMEKPALLRHLVVSYSTKRKMMNFLRMTEQEFEEVEDIEDLVEKRKEKFTIFEVMRPYSKGKWAEILNEIYKIDYENIRGYI